MERKFTIGKKGSIWTVYDSHAELHVHDCGEGDKGHAEAKATCESWNARRIVVNVPPTRCKRCFTGAIVLDDPMASEIRQRIHETIARRKARQEELLRDDSYQIFLKPKTERVDARTEFKKAWLERFPSNLTYPGETLNDTHHKTALKTLGFDSNTLGTEWDGETELTAGMTVSGGILLYIDARNAIIKTDTGFTTMKREDVKPVTFRDGVTLGEAEEIERLAKIAYEAGGFSSAWEDLFDFSKNHYITIAKTLRKEILK